MTDFFLKEGSLRPSNAAVALILVGETPRYLMQLRDQKAGIFYPGHWGLFGGAIDPGEAPEITLQRELTEELGLSGAQLAILPSSNSISHSAAMATSSADATSCNFLRTGLQRSCSGRAATCAPSGRRRSSMNRALRHMMRLPSGCTRPGRELWRSARLIGRSKQRIGLVQRRETHHLRLLQKLMILRKNTVGLAVRNNMTMVQ